MLKKRGKNLKTGSAYLERIIRKMRDYSIHPEVDDFDLFDEWRVTGEEEDLGEPVADCELCDHPHIRYQNRIIHNDTNAELLIGSECIKNYGIAFEDEEVESMDAKEKSAYMRKRRKLGATRMVINKLQELSTLDEGTHYASIAMGAASYYSEHGYLTPKLATCMAYRGGIHFKGALKDNFLKTLRVNLKDFHGQVADLADWRITNNLFTVLTEAQKNSVRKIRGWS